MSAKYPLGNSSIVDEKPTLYDKSRFGTNEFYGKFAKNLDNRRD